MLSITILFALWALIFGGRTTHICSKLRCDFLKAFLPFFIIFHHFVQYVDCPTIIEKDAATLGPFVVMVFFFISGYGLSYKRSLNGISLQELPSRLWKLFAPTLLPVLMYTGILFSRYCLTGKDFIAPILHTLHLVHYPLPYSWFVVVLAALYVGFYLCTVKTKDNKTFLFALFGYVAGLFVVQKFVLHSPGWMMGSNFAFPIGALFMCYERQILNLLHKYQLRIPLITQAVVLTVGSVHTGNEFANILRLAEYALLPMLMLIFSYVSIRHSAIVNFLSGISYEVYLCQGIAFLIVNAVHTPDWITFFLVIPLTVLLAWFCQSINNRLMRKRTAL